MNNKHPTKPFCGECDHYHNSDEPHGTCEICPGSSTFKDFKFHNQHSYIANSKGEEIFIIFDTRTSKMNNKNQKESWEERFDSEFDLSLYMRTEIKKFIQQEIDRAVEESDKEYSGILWALFKMLSTPKEK